MLIFFGNNLNAIIPRSVIGFCPAQASNSPATIFRNWRILSEVYLLYILPLKMLAKKFERAKLGVNPACVNPGGQGNKEYGNQYKASK